MKYRVQGRVSLCRGFSLKNESTWNNNAGPVHVEESPKATATQKLHTDWGSTLSSQNLHSNTDPNTDAPATNQEGACRPAGREIHGTIFFRCFERSYLNMSKQQLGTRESLINLSGGQDRKDFAKEVMLSASTAGE